MSSEAVSFLRNYSFMGISKSVSEAQSQICKENNETYGQIGSKAARYAGLSGLSFIALGADMALAPCLAAIRWCGCFNPLPPQPPEFPRPHNNAQFMDVSVQRALWDWNPALKNEMLEEIADGLVDKWNVFQVVGEWCLANAFENPDYYRPTFLTVSEPLENGETFRSVGQAFSRLKQKDKAAILEAVYHQAEIKSVSSSGKKVYQDLRSLASKLTQGNEAFQNSFKELMAKAAEAAPAPTEAAPLPERTTAAPQRAASIPTPVSVYPSVPASYRYEPFAPTFASLNQALEPSAPDFDPRGSGDQIQRDLDFLRKSVKEGIRFLPEHEKRKVIDLITGDASGATSRGNAPVETSPRYCVARLTMLHFFKEAFKERGSFNVPNFLWTHALTANNKSLQEVGQAFADLHERDYAKIQQTILHPLELPRLDETLRKRLSELNDFAEIVSKNQEFSQMYGRLQIDLIAV